MRSAHAATVVPDADRSTIPYAVRSDIIDEIVPCHDVREALPKAGRETRLIGRAHTQNDRRRRVHGVQWNVRSITEPAFAEPIDSACLDRRPRARRVGAEKA